MEDLEDYLPLRTGGAIQLHVFVGVLFIRLFLPAACVFRLRDEKCSTD